ncbi:hemin uptake protein HemP [Halodurantibacterium flavum]|uniref:Hemin uptake protein HemP n=1 Tax=Halodurantibacterium flavum TaxID=1382802 RepID=A0ABW4S2U1_9RHOB
MNMIVTQPHLAHAVSSLPLHDATELTGGGIQAQIRLNDQIYTLRITKAGKLILTK